MEGERLIEERAYYAFLDVTFLGYLRRLPRVRQWEKHFKKEVAQRTYPRGILFDIMALGVGAYLGESAYFRKYASP